MEKDKINLKDLKFEFNLKDCDFQLDVLQNELLKSYLRVDQRFRRAFSQNYTSQFLQFLKDKARLKEPIHISTIGAVRGGKSYSMMTVAVLLSALHGRKFTIDYVCANAYEFIEKLKSFPEDKLLNSCFLVDEEKQSVYGVGSIAKKMKLVDVQNIIAINNISTIMINPNSWQNKEAMYGLRCFGRCFKTKTCRFMLYNLQAGGKQSELPMGNVYLPIFTQLLPKNLADELEKAYLQKKKEWVRGEMRGEGDVLYEISRKSAESFVNDKKYLELKKRGEKEAYINAKMGSEWTKGEIKQIYELTKLLERGVL